MNYASIEKSIEALIRAHGVETVNAHLETLVGATQWASWQTLHSLIRNVNNRIQRETEKSRLDQKPAPKNACA